MKKIRFVLVFILPVIIGLSSCQDETAKKLEPGDPSMVPTGVITGSVIDNLGTSAVFSVTVGGNTGGVLLDNGIIVSTANDFTISTPGIFIGSAKEAVTGESEAKVEGLSKSTPYNYRAFSYNTNGVTYGEIKSFETSNFTVSPYKTQFRSDVPSDIADWVFDEYTGFDESGEDWVWFNDDVDETCVSAYNVGWDLTLISPLIKINNKLDTLSFNFLTGGYGSPQTVVKVYITEDLDDYGAPVKNWTFDTIKASTKIGMEAYFEKAVYVVIVIEEGDFILWDFAIAPPSLKK